MSRADAGASRLLFLIPAEGARTPAADAAGPSGAAPLVWGDAEVPGGIRLDGIGAPDRLWARVVEAAGDVAGVSDLRGLLGFPGLEDVALLGELLAGGGGTVVCGQGTQMLRRLAAPRDLLDVVEALWPRHRRLAGLSGGSNTERAVSEVVQALVEYVEGVHFAMSDPERVRIRVFGDAEGIRGLAAVAELLGLRGVEGAVGGGEPFDPGVARVEAAISGREGSGLESIYTFRVRLPSEEAPTLARREEHLILGARGVRARVSLPSVLRRCIPIGARWEADGRGAGALEVRFRPDPAVWPVATPRSTGTREGG